MITNILLNANTGQILKRSITGSPDNDVKEKVKSIVRAVSSNRLSYLNNSFDFKKTGITQKINLPQETLTKRIVNNTDASVLMAALFEKNGLDPVIVLLPNHCIVGVRVDSDTGKIFLIEPSVISTLSLVTTFSFEKAYETSVNQAESEFKNAMSANAKSVDIIDIKKCRKNGIYPLW
jgi:PIN domain nuclease of toxin-antitoxin system